MAETPVLGHDNRAPQEREKQPPPNIIQNIGRTANNNEFRRPQIQIIYLNE